MTAFDRGSCSSLVSAARRRAARAPRRGGGDRPDRERAGAHARAGRLARHLRRDAAAVVALRPAQRRLPVRRAARLDADFGIQYLVGVDGISLLLIVLTGFLTPLALLSSWDSVHKSVKMFSFFMLALESAMLGVFVSIDLFLFYVFWDAMLIPMYFLIGIWGYERRIYAAVKFILYTMAGSVLMLVAIIGLAWAHAEANGGAELQPARSLQRLTLSRPLEKWFFLAFARRVRDQGAAVPVPHLAARRARRGADGRLGHPGRRAAEDGHLRAAALRVSAVSRRRRCTSRRGIAVLAVIGIVYGALVAMVQPDMKKLVAYSSVSHLGFVVLGLCAMNVQGVQGVGLPDAESRRQHGRPVHDRRHAVGPAPHAAHLRVRRTEGGHAAAGRRVPADHAVVDRAARA